MALGAVGNSNPKHMRALPVHGLDGVLTRFQAGPRFGGKMDRSISRGKLVPSDNIKFREGAVSLNNPVFAC